MAGFTAINTDPGAAMSLQTRGYNAAMSSQTRGYSAAMSSQTLPGGGALDSRTSLATSLGNTTPYTLSTISCSDVLHCMTVGSTGSGFTTNDGGQSWSRFDSGINELLYGVLCITSQQCWAVGESGTIIMTDNFGGTWTQQDSGTTQMLFSISCPSSTQCWVGGDNGVILSTINGGANWSTQVSGTTNSYYSISCPTVSICIAGSNSNSITVTDNGGLNWTQTSINLVEGFFGVNCPSPSQCVAVGSGSAIVTSQDSGANFNVALPGTTNLYQQALWALSCASTSNCVAVGTGQLIATTANGGLNWSFSKLPIVDNYLGVSCPSSQVCFASGGSGNILTTDNAGLTWSSSYSPPLSTTGHAPILLVGDSMANTMGIGLAATADWYGMEIYNEGILGCGVTEGQPIILDGTSQDVNGNCNGLPSPTNPQLEQFWQSDINTYDPSVVILFAGRWETVDRLYNGTMSNITEPAYQQYVFSQLYKAAEILTSRGAHLVLLTSPYFSEPGPGPGQIYDQDQPVRVDDYNSLLYKVASDFQSRVSVIDLNAYVDPNGQYSQYISGVEVRSDDGVHFSIPGGEWIANWLLPQIQQLEPKALNPDGGYWMVGSDGSVYSYGDAQFFGSMGGRPLDKPIVAIAATPDGQGYWEVASDGGIFAFGDAQFYGSTGGISLVAPIVSISYDPETSGYWLVASDGGVFSFGPSGLTSFYGSASGSTLSPIVGIACYAGGSGYWLATQSGYIFGYGQATPVESNIFPVNDIIGIISTPA